MRGMVVGEGGRSSGVLLYQGIQQIERPIDISKIKIWIGKKSHNEYLQEKTQYQIVPWDYSIKQNATQ